MEKKYRSFKEVKDKLDFLSAVNYKIFEMREKYPLLNKAISEIFPHFSTREKWFFAKEDGLIFVAQYDEKGRFYNLDSNFEKTHPANCLHTASNNVPPLDPKDLPVEFAKKTRFVLESLASN